MQAEMTSSLPFSGQMMGLSQQEFISISMVFFASSRVFRAAPWSWGMHRRDRASCTRLPLSSKEGLALVSGTTSATAMAALALYDMLNAAKSADIVGGGEVAYAAAAGGTGG